MEQKIPKEITTLKHKLMPINPTAVEIIVGLHVFFDDYEKICAWLETSNPNFGGTAPLRLMQLGRGSKVLQFIDDAARGRTPL